MKKFLIVLTMVLASWKGIAQAAEDSVKLAVNKMFLAMKNADSTSLRSCFSTTMVLQTISRNKEGNTVVVNESADEFIGSIQQLLPGEADERISFETIRIDGPLAIAWTPYKFYYKGKFSHCGVNSFQLVRFEGEWKVQYIIDTRRRVGCE
ncbi:MAG: hypothetical protein IPQ08_04425 [Chitinophagaceae bacterium]|nr:hypothetical protein [Chitinophagaceae bacterium]